MISPLLASPARNETNLAQRGSAGNRSTERIQPHRGDTWNGKALSSGASPPGVIPTRSPQRATKRSAVAVPAQPQLEFGKRHYPPTPCQSRQGRNKPSPARKRWESINRKDPAPSGRHMEAKSAHTDQHESVIPVHVPSPPVPASPSRPLRSYLINSSLGGRSFSSDMKKPEKVGFSP
jgi:hypothetical protein